MEDAFLRRVKRAEKPAEDYLAQFPSDLMQIAARFLTFVGGSFAAICLVITGAPQAGAPRVFLTPLPASPDPLGICHTKLFVGDCCTNSVWTPLTLDPRWRRGGTRGGERAERCR